MLMIIAYYFHSFGFTGSSSIVCDLFITRILQVYEYCYKMDIFILRVVYMFNIPNTQMLRRNVFVLQLNFFQFLTQAHACLFFPTAAMCCCLKKSINILFHLINSQPRAEVFSKCLDAFVGT